MINKSQHLSVEKGFRELFVWRRPHVLICRALKDLLDSHRHVRNMDVDKISLACPVPELSQCFHKGHTLDIANRTTLVDGKFQSKR